MADHPLRTAAANLWHRRWTLALLWVLMSVVLAELARATFSVNAAIDLYLIELGVWEFMRPYR